MFRKRYFLFYEELLKKLQRSEKHPWPVLIGLNASNFDKYKVNNIADIIFVTIEHVKWTFTR